MSIHIQKYSMKSLEDIKMRFIIGNQDGSQDINRLEVCKAAGHPFSYGCLSRK